MKEFVEKLIERLEENVKSCEISMKFKFAYNMDYQYVDGKRVAFNECVEIVKKLVEEYNQDSTKKNQGWILCSERLPENYETVNITWINKKPAPYYENIKDKPFMGTAIFHYGKWYWYSCVCEDYLRECGDSTCDRMDKDIEVIAWQPLQEPYEREEY